MNHVFDPLFRAAIDFIMADPANPVAKYVVSPIALVASYLVYGGTF